MLSYDCYTSESSRRCKREQDQEQEVGKSTFLANDSTTFILMSVHDVTDEPRQPASSLNDHYHTAKQFQVETFHLQMEKLDLSSRRATSDEEAQEEGKVFYLFSTPEL